MLLMQDFYASIQNLMLLDPDFLASESAPGVSDLRIYAVTAPFTPTKNLSLGDITLPPTGLLADKSVLLGSSSQVLVTDAAGNLGIQLTEPLGGFTFFLADPDLGPADIYGFVLGPGDADAPDSLMAAATITPTRLSLLGQSIQVSAILGFLAGEIFQISTVVISTGTPVPVS